MQATAPRGPQNNPHPGRGTSPTRPIAAPLKPPELRAVAKVFPSKATAPTVSQEGDLLSLLA